MWVPGGSADLVTWAGATGKHSAIARASRPARRPTRRLPPARKAAGAAPAGASAAAAPKKKKRSAVSHSPLATIRKTASRLLRKVKKVATRIGRKVVARPKATKVRRPRR